MGEGAAEAHAEVIDQSIWMFRSIRDCRDIGDKVELADLASFSHNEFRPERKKT